jgi:hypothetical protein
MSELKRSRDFDRMIVEAIQENVSFYAWQSISGVVEKTELKIKAYRKDYNEIELEICEGEEDQMGKVISGNRILNIYVPELSVSFSSELKAVSADKKIKLYPPISYTFYERRKHERIIPVKTCHVSFEHNKQMVKKSIFDISLGGIAIVLAKSDKINIEKNKVFDNLSLSIGLKKITIKAECVSSVSIDRFKFDYLPYGGYKIAFKFIDMSKEDKKLLIDFVTEERLSQATIKKAN